MQYRSRAAAVLVVLALAIVATPHAPRSAPPPAMGPLTSGPGTSVEVTAPRSTGAAPNPAPTPVYELWRPKNQTVPLPPALKKAAAPRPAPPTPVDCRRDACVALTFDDGPGPYSVKLAQQLHGLGAQATFYMVGRMVSEDPAAVRTIARIPGMEIGAHTMTHPPLTQIGAARADSEIGENVTQLRALAGPSVTTMRPPYGDRSPATDAIAKRHGLAVMMWEVDTLDWQSRSTPTTVTRAVKGARPGSIILMHDIHAPTVRAAPQIAKQLQRRGYTLVTVSELLGATTPGVVYTSR